MKSETLFGQTFLGHPIVKSSEPLPSSQAVQYGNFSQYKMVQEIKHKDGTTIKRVDGGWQIDKVGFADTIYENLQEAIAAYEGSLKGQSQ